MTQFFYLFLRWRVEEPAELKDVKEDADSV